MIKFKEQIKTKTEKAPIEPGEEEKGPDKSYSEVEHQELGVRTPIFGDTTEEEVEDRNFLVNFQLPPPLARFWWKGGTMWANMTQRNTTTCGK